MLKLKMLQPLEVLVAPQLGLQEYAQALGGTVVVEPNTGHVTYTSPSFSGYQFTFPDQQTFQAAIARDTLIIPTEAPSYSLYDPVRTDEPGQIRFAAITRLERIKPDSAATFATTVISFPPDVRAFDLAAATEFITRLSAPSQNYCGVLLDFSQLPDNRAKDFRRALAILLHERSINVVLQLIANLNKNYGMISAATAPELKTTISINENVNPEHKQSLLDLSEFGAGQIAAGYAMLRNLFADYQKA